MDTKLACSEGSQPHILGCRKGSGNIICFSFFLSLFRGVEPGPLISVNGSDDDDDFVKQHLPLEDEGHLLATRFRIFFRLSR